MKEKLRHNFKSEIDLKDLLSCLYHYKFMILGILCVTVLAAGYHLGQAQKEFTAKSIFSLETSEKPNSLLANSLGSLGSLASLAGINPKKNSTALLIERITARDFILEVAEELNLKSDSYFNNFDHDKKDPRWKVAVKFILDWKEKKSVNPAQIADWNVLRSFNKNISITTTEAGAIEINVTHKIPEKAASIANHIVSKVIRMIKEETFNEVETRLDYLAGSLAEALQDFDNAEEALKRFTLVNNVQAEQSFAAGSIILDDLRTKRDASENQIKTIRILKQAYSRKAPDFEDYLALRQDHPILDQSSFRRILGLPETTSAWKWPSLLTLSQVEDSISDRLRSIEVEIKKYEVGTQRYAESAAGLAELTRNLKIAEATSKVLIEQVKSESLVAGFRPDASQVYAIADVPILPSSPNTKLILAASIFFGLFAGSSIALLLGYRKRVYFSSSSMIQNANPTFVHKISFLRKFYSKSLLELRHSVTYHTDDWPAQVAIEAIDNSKSQVIFVVDSTPLKASTAISRIIGMRNAERGKNTGILCLDAPPRLLKVTETILNQDQTIFPIEDVDGCTQYTFPEGYNNIGWLLSRKASEDLDQLFKKHQTIILSFDWKHFEIVKKVPLFNDANVILFARKAKAGKEGIFEFSQSENTRVLLHA